MYTVGAHVCTVGMAPAAVSVCVFLVSVCVSVFTLGYMSGHVQGVCTAHVSVCTSVDACECRYESAQCVFTQ